MVELGTKADTLEAIRTRIQSAKVCPSVVFTVRDWKSAPEKQLEKVASEFGARSVIVRSSAIGEDSAASAMAGMHASILDIPADSATRLRAAVDEVVGSYAKHSSAGLEQNQVLVQPFVTNVSMSGVIFTRDLNTGAPYYVINYDDETGKTDTVTSGTGDTSRTLLIHRGNLASLRSSRFQSLLEAVTEIEAMVPGVALDIEFAVTFAEEIYIFQVRRLAVEGNWNQQATKELDVALAQVNAFLNTRFRPAAGVLGHKSIFGEMSDWNPAEMIGSVPRRLASSLYQHLITDSVWAEARAEMGYRDLSGRSLMASLGGRPYIDVRESFNSFLPAGLSEQVGEKLVTHWLQTLEARPELHDKVEFEVATTVHSFDFDERVAPALEGNPLSKTEVADFKRALLSLTNGVVAGKAMFRAQYAALDEMQARRKEALAFAKAGNGPLQLAKQLLVDCRRFGTKPFAILARCGFIAEDFLRSLVRAGLLEAGEATAFRRSVRTVLSDFIEKAKGFQEGKVGEAELFAEFGHLRPGTYNILSQRYDQRAALLGRAQGAGVAAAAGAGGASAGPKAFHLPAAKRSAIDAFLKAKGYAFDCDRLFEFLRASIEGREFAKLRFTQNLSDALELIASWGATLGLSREELSHLSIQDVLRTLTATPMVPVAEHFRALVNQAEVEYDRSQAIKLPYLIVDTADVHVVPLLKSRPNFITQKSVEADVIFLSGQAISPQSLDDRIVLIEGADPGYDWIFMSRLRGLITKFGGANSHMAIRCAELGIPAAIGAGEQLFDLALQAKTVSLDCGAGLITPTE